MTFQVTTPFTSIIKTSFVRSTNNIHKATILAFLVFFLDANSYGKAVRPKWPRLVDNSAYVSIQSAEDGHRSTVNILGSNFIMRSIGGDQKESSDSHEGGAVFVKEFKNYFLLNNIGIMLPKDSIGSWKSAALVCKSSSLSADLLSVHCVTSERGSSLVSIYSKQRGVLSFTGFCWITPNHLCDYVLVSDVGIAPRRARK